MVGNQYTARIGSIGGLDMEEIYKTWSYKRHRIDMVNKDGEILYKVITPDGKSYKYERLFDDAKTMIDVISTVGLAELDTPKGFKRKDKFFY